MINVTLFAELFFSREANGIHTAVLQLEEQFKFSENFRLSFKEITADTDVIHAHTVGPRYLWQSFRHQDKLIVTAHVIPNICLGGVRFDKLCVFFSKIYLRVAYNRAQMVIAVSPLVKKELLDLGVRKNIAVICNSVDRQKFKPDGDLKAEFKQRLKLKPDEFVVLGVGQIQPRKGITSFVKVAERLPHLKFVWVGGCPFGRLAADYEALTHLIEHPPANVTFIGVIPYDDMPGYYSMADAFLFPSYNECFSYAILEASATSLPLVLRENSEYPTYLFDHYLSAETEDGLAELLNHLYKDQAYFIKWQRESLDLAKRYDIVDFNEQIATCYQSIASE